MLCNYVPGNDKMLITFGVAVAQEVDGSMRSSSCYVKVSLGKTRLVLALALLSSVCENG